MPGPRRFASQPPALLSPSLPGTGFHFISHVHVKWPGKAGVPTADWSELPWALGTARSMKGQCPGVAPSWQGPEPHILTPQLRDRGCWSPALSAACGDVGQVAGVPLPGAKRSCPAPSCTLHPSTPNTELPKSRACVREQRQRSCHCLSCGPCSPSPHQRLCQITADHRKPPPPPRVSAQAAPEYCPHLSAPWGGPGPTGQPAPPTTRVPAGDGPFCLGWWALARAGSSQVNQHHPFAAQTPDPRAQLSQCHLKLTIWARGGCRGRSWGCHENPHAGISSFGEAEPYFAGGVGF